jgi:glucose-6-phosphate 1-dehydrogenase
MRGLAGQLQRLEAGRNLPGNRLSYLATDPDYFGPLVQGLAAAQLVRRETERPWARVVIENPFVHDLASAAELAARKLLPALYGLWRDRARGGDAPGPGRGSVQRHARGAVAGRNSRRR